MLTIRPRTVTVGILGALVFLVAACSTPYQKLDRAGGYYDFKLEENRYYVYFGGNAYTTRSEAFRKARRRAAEIASEHSAPYFRLVEINRDASRYSTKLGSNTDRSYEQPVVTLIVTLHADRPDGNNVYRTDGFVDG